MFLKGKNQDGFSLAEMVIVIVIIGFITVIVSRNIGSNSVSQARVEALETVADKVITNWNRLCQEAGYRVTDYSSMPGINSEDDVLSLLILGQSFSGFPSGDKKFVSAWKTAGVSPLSDAVTVENKGSAEFLVEGHKIDIVDLDKENFGVSYRDVPSSLVRGIIEDKYGDTGSYGKTEGDILYEDCNLDNASERCTLTFYRHWKD